MEKRNHVGFYPAKAGKERPTALFELFSKRLVVTNFQTFQLRNKPGTCSGVQNQGCPIKMNPRKNKTPIVSIVGFSGAGKTTLIEKLIPRLTQRGLRVGTIKHHKHRFEMDRPGKDSWRHKKAGAAVTIVSSPHQIGMVMDVDHDHRPEELAMIVPNVDIILTEGYKKEKNDKIEVFGPKTHGGLLFKDDAHLVAVVSDAKIDLEVPQFSTDDVEALANFIIDNFKLDPAVSSQQLETAS
jgi:molybdopterin-guanine dinucleotide biosynthesis protein B